jgi:uncharacterized protein (TIGR03118 family)
LLVFRARHLVATVAVPLMLLAAAPASAHPATAGFVEIKQVANQPGHAKVRDADAVNSWGLALSPTSPLWVANNGTNTATLYSGGLNGAAVTKAGLTVTIDSDAPTGQVFNGTGRFVVPGGGSAPFIFDTESGDIDAWSPSANMTHALFVTHVDGAVFKGLALWNSPLGPFLLATDFNQGRVDVFDGGFNQVDLGGVLFRDPHLPKGYAPFDVLAVGDTVYVSYAKQQAGSEDEAHGAGLGVVDAYTDLGTTVHRIATHGTLNAPWGLAIAPAGFGQIGGDLLVGNFGDGRINVFHGSHFVDQLRGRNGRPITIDGLWALLPGTAATGGVHTVWFSAGPHGETRGLVGQLVPAG